MPTRACRAQPDIWECMVNLLKIAPFLWKIGKCRDSGQTPQNMATDQNAYRTYCVGKLEKTICKNEYHTTLTLEMGGQNIVK